MEKQSKNEIYYKCNCREGERIDRSLRYNKEAEWGHMHISLVVEELSRVHIGTYSVVNLTDVPCTRSNGRIPLLYSRTVY